LIAFPLWFLSNRWRLAVARWMLTSLTPTSRAVLTIAAQVAATLSEKPR
jgi:hypothetical protein